MTHEKLEDGETTPLVLRRVIEGVVVRYIEESHVIEGAPPREAADTIVVDACSKLAALEGVAYTKSRIV